MSVAEYVSVFISIIVGLAIADLLISFHRLVRPGAKVRWYWLVPTLALYLLLVIVNFWWGSFSWLSHVRTMSMVEFLPTLLAAIIIFLLAAAVLPDEIPAEGIDLRSWYLQNSRQIWILASIGICVVMFLGTDFITSMLTASGKVDAAEFALVFARSEWDNLLTLAAFICLIFSKRLRLHEAVVVLSLIDIIYTANWLQLG